MLVYSTTTGQSPVDPEGYAKPADDDFGQFTHSFCAHSIGYCGDADWD